MYILKEVVDRYPKMLLTQYATVKTNAVQWPATKDIQFKQKAQYHGKCYYNEKCVYKHTQVF